MLDNQKIKQTEIYKLQFNLEVSELVMELILCKEFNF
jgi:hypothetical protein